MAYILVLGAFLVLLTNSCRGSAVCDEVQLGDLKEESTNVCYNNQHKSIQCSRNEKLLVLKILQRATVDADCKDSSTEYSCCRAKLGDKLYDIGGCSLNQTDAAAKRTYQAAITEVLEECSQKRYCILESDLGSSIHALKDLTVGDAGARPSHLMVIYKCIKDEEASMTLCEKMTTSGKEVYISSNRLKMSSLETSTCTCTVSGAASRVTLLDVRLGNSHVTTLSMRDKTRTVYTIQGGDLAVHFMKSVLVSQSEWTIEADVSRDYLPDIWMKVEGNPVVTVACEEPVKHRDAIPTGPPEQSPGSLGFITSHNLVPLVMGFVLGGISVCVVYVIYVRRKQRQLKPTAAPKPAHDAPEDNDYEDPIYAVPHQVLGVSSSHQPTAGGPRPLKPTDSSVESSPKTNHISMTIQIESPSETDHNAIKSQLESSPKTDHNAMTIQLESSAETDNNAVNIQVESSPETDHNAMTIQLESSSETDNNAVNIQVESSPETDHNAMTIQLESSAETDNNAAKIQVESSPETDHNAPKILIAPPPKTEHSALSRSCGTDRDDTDSPRSNVVLGTKE